MASTKGTQMFFISGESVFLLVRQSLSCSDRSRVSIGGVMAKIAPPRSQKFVTGHLLSAYAACYYFHEKALLTKLNSHFSLKMLCGYFWLPINI